MRAIWKRELKSYFQTVTGWLFIAATLALFGLYFLIKNFDYPEKPLKYKHIRRISD